MTPDYVTLLDLFSEHTATVNTLWGVFQVVALALLGFVYKDELFRRSAWILAVFTIAFVGFAVANQHAMLRSQAVLRAISGALQNTALLATTPAPIRQVLAAHEAPTVEEIRCAHWVFTRGVVIALWVPFTFGKVDPLRSRDTQTQQ